MKLPLRRLKDTRGALIWSIFIGFLFLSPYKRHASWLEWGLTILGAAVFMVLYVAAITSWTRGRKALWVLAAVTLLGILFAPFNAGASLFFVYAASFIPFCVRGKIRLSVALLSVLLAIVALESWLLDLHWSFWAYAAGYSVIMVAGHIYVAQALIANERLRAAHEEIERLAKVAERERIARDLHDVLGHTLTVIIVKAELAGRLLEHDLQRAKAEIADLERISRDALAEVRHTVRSYRADGLQAEFERAKSTLEMAGVAVECHTAQVAMTANQESVLSLALREAVTNVVRHAQARSCRLEIQQMNGECRLEVQDDGRGGAHTEGYGLRGMRERIEALGGVVSRDAHAGTKLTIILPLPS